MTKPRPRRFVTAVIGFLVTFGLAWAKPVTFDILAQPAPSALKTFVKQSSLQVVFDPGTLQDVRVNTVQGDFEPEAALTALLQGTGAIATPGQGGIFVVKKSGAEVTTGSIEGAIQDNQTGRPVANARVALAGTDLSVLTDRRGRFTFAAAPAGENDLEITAEGIQNTKVTDVTVKAGHKLTLSTINVPVKSPGVVQLDTYIVSAKKNDGVVELNPYDVYSTKPAPFSTANIDLTRTRDDVMPYATFSARDIENSGAANVEEFFRLRLSQNFQDRIASEINGPLAESSISDNVNKINLRGMSGRTVAGSNAEIVILLDGRRLPGRFSATDNGSFPSAGNFRGIPLGAIERIEVLPAAGSAIYGEGATSGVVNIITKQSFKGGALSVTYETPVDTYAPKRILDLNYAFPLTSAITARITCSYRDSIPLTVGDRADVTVGRWRSLISARDPNFLINGIFTPPLSQPARINRSHHITSTVKRRGGNLRQFT